MQKNSLGAAFAELRAASGLTMREVAQKSGLSEPVVWKLEGDRPVRWETVHAIVTIRAFKVSPKSARYQEFHRRWLKQRQERAAAKPDGFWKHTISPHAINATDKFRNLVRNLSPDDTKKVLAAAARSARTLL